MAMGTRKILHDEVERRFFTEGREEHKEDLLVTTILDPRFKLMDFQGCIRDMKSLAERYLRDNYVADWAPRPTLENGMFALIFTISIVPLLTFKSLTVAEGVTAPKEKKTLKEPLKRRVKKVKTGLAAFAAEFFEYESEEEEEEEHNVPRPNPVLYSEVDYYLKLPAMSIRKNGRDACPLDWWSVNCTQMPNLSKMARQFLAMPASSAGCERVFNVAGKLHDDFRKSINDETLCMMLEV